MSAQNLLGNLALDATLSALAAAANKEATQLAVLAALQGTIGDNGAQWITGTKTKFRDGFTTGTPGQPVDPAVWNLVNEAPDSGNGQGHLVLPGGDAAGASYLRVSLSPWAVGTSVHLSSVGKFQIPFRHAWGVTASQRLMGQEVLFGLAEALDSDAQLGLNRVAQPADLAISGTVSITSNVGTITFAAPHGLRGGDRVILVGNARRELNVGPVYVTVVDALNITVPIVLANGAYPAGGSVRVAEPTALLNNAALQLWADTATNGQATYATRRNGTKYRTLLSQGTLASAPTQNNVSPYSDAWLAPGPTEIWATIDEVVWRSYADSTAGTSGYNKMTQSIPDESLLYRLYARAKVLDNMSRPIARITSAAKTASTTVTVTTDVPHGLAVNDTVSVVGVRDQVNFPAAAVPVVTVPTATTFTVVLGPSATATDALGGVVWLNLGNVSTPGNVSQYVQSIQSVQTGVLQIVGNTTWSGPAVGDTVNLYGTLAGAARAYEGVYKVARLNGATMDVVPLSGSVATFASITTGGQVIRRTDVRLHYARILDYSRILTEVVGGRGNVADGNNAVPVAVTGFGPTPNVTPMIVFGTTEPVTNGVLGAGATYTQPAVQVSGSGTSFKPTRVRVIVGHTAGTTPGTLILQQSSDNATFRETWRAPIPSDAGYHTFELPLHLGYYRFLFTNGATAQTAFWFSTLVVRGEGTNAVDVTQNLPFMLTPAAGQALALSAAFTGPTLDLGVTHGWSVQRLLVASDQVTAAAPTGVALQQSMDGVTWFTTASTAITTAGTAVFLEDKIVARYVRCLVTNGATAATALRVIQSLLTI